MVETRCLCDHCKEPIIEGWGRTLIGHWRPATIEHQNVSGVLTDAFTYQEHACTIAHQRELDLKAMGAPAIVTTDFVTNAETGYSKSFREFRDGKTASCGDV